MNRSTRSIRPCMMSVPPTVITATLRIERKNSSEPEKMPISRWNSRFETLKRSLASLNLPNSTASFAKAFAVRMPESEDSISALMAAVRFFTPREDPAHFPAARDDDDKQDRQDDAHDQGQPPLDREHDGERARPIVSREIIRSSGPWCASSVISNRSVVRRLMSWPCGCGHRIHSRGSACGGTGRGGYRPQRGCRTCGRNRR